MSSLSRHFSVRKLKIPVEEDFYKCIYVLKVLIFIFMAHVREHRLNVVTLA